MMIFRLIVTFLCIFFVFVDGGKLLGVEKFVQKFYSNAFSAKLGDNYKLPSNEPLQDGPKVDDDLYPDPDTFHRKIFNKSKNDGSERNDESIIKICE